MIAWDVLRQPRQWRTAGCSPQFWRRGPSLSHPRSMQLASLIHGSFLSCLLFLTTALEGESSGCEHQSRQERDENQRDGEPQTTAAQEASMATREARLPSLDPDTQAELTFVMATGLQKAELRYVPCVYLLRLSRGQHEMELILGDGPNVWINNSVSR